MDSEQGVLYIRNQGALCLHEADEQSKHCAGLVIYHVDVLLLGGTYTVAFPVQIPALPEMEVVDLLCIWVVRARSIEAS